MRAYFPIILLLSTAIAHGDSCNALLNVGIYNTTTTASAIDANSMALSTFCSTDYSSSNTSNAQTGQIEASYGLFSGGASRSYSRQDIITKQSQLCTSGFNSSAYSNKASGYAKIIYQGALDSWNKCQQLAQQGLVFSIQPSSTMQGITVSITTPTGLAATYYGVTQYGSGKSTCTTLANGAVLQPSENQPFRFSSESRVTVTCKREMVATDHDLSADAQDLVFVTSADSLTVPLSAIGNFSRVTADKIGADTVNELRQELIARIPKGAVAAFNLPECPDGWGSFEELAGRVIVGSGNGDRLTSRVFGQSGGEENHKLVNDEMPRHRHQLPTYNAQGGSHEVGSGHFGMDWIPQEFSEYEGGNRPHNNMQPYYVLTMCKRK